MLYGLSWLVPSLWYFLFFASFIHLWPWRLLLFALNNDTTCLTSTWGRFAFLQLWWCLIAFKSNFIMISNNLKDLLASPDYPARASGSNLCISEARQATFFLEFSRAKLSPLALSIAAPNLLSPGSSLLFMPQANGSWLAFSWQAQVGGNEWKNVLSLHLIKR